MPANTFVPKGKNYLYIVGIDKYEHLPQLYNAKLDAEQVRSVLEEKYQFDPGLTHCHFDEEATHANITNYLERLVEVIKEEDTFLMYFAGHGEYKKMLDVGYWMPYDAQQDRIGTYISFDLVTRLIRAINSRHTFIITDSCYSGSIFTQKRDANFKDRLESLPSRWLLTAGRNEPVSDGRLGQHSPFAQAVIKILKNNYEDRLRVSVFCNRVLEAVGNNVNDQLPRGAALHDVGDMGGEFMFRLKAYTYAPVAEPSASAPEPAAPVRGGNEPAPQADSPAAPSGAPGDLAALKRQLKKYFQQSEFKRAFDLLNEYIADNSYRETDIIMQQSRYNGMHRQKMQGMVDASFAEMTFNQVRYAMLDLVDNLEESDIKAGLFSNGPAAGGNPPANLDELARQGLEQQATTLQRKLNFLQNEAAKAYDASQKFTLNEQIKETEHQLEEVRKKLGG